MPEPVRKVSRQDLIRAFWPSDSGHSMKTWAIFDCARDERIYGAVNASSQEHCCLFAGALAPALRVVAPQLVQLDPDDRLTAYVLNNGWGHAWGIFLRSNASIEALRRHFRTFLRVRVPDGKHLLFRYYDPRVLRIYLQTCLPDELNTVFGTVVDTILIEADDGSGILRYRKDGRP